MKKKITVLFFLIGLVGTFACNRQQNFIPKPPTYLEILFPERDYSFYMDSCGYSFNKPKYFNVQKAASANLCNRDIVFTDLNGMLNLSRIDMDTTLDAYVNHVIDNVSEHKIKASAIFDSSFVRNESKVFGTIFELQGNVATPFQFYLTDSTTRFVSGVVYFNSRPNYDSIKPVLDFVKTDLINIFTTFEWEKNDSIPNTNSVSKK